MSRQMLIIIGVLLLVFGSGIGIGLFIGSGPGGSGALAKMSGGTTSPGFFADSNAAERVNDNKILSDRIRELEKELAERKQVQNDATVAASRIAFFKKYHDKVRMSAFDNHFEVTPEMA